MTIQFNIHPTCVPSQHGATGINDINTLSTHKTTVRLVSTIYQLNIVMIMKFPPLLIANYI